MRFALRPLQVCWGQMTVVDCAQQISDPKPGQTGGNQYSHKCVGWLKQTPTESVDPNKTLRPTKHVTTRSSGELSESHRVCVPFHLGSLGSPFSAHFSVPLPRRTIPFSTFFFIMEEGLVMVRPKDWHLALISPSEKTPRRRRRISFSQSRMGEATTKSLHLRLSPTNLAPWVNSR